MDKLKVIYIASLGHSGSTLLDVMLNQHSKFQSVGEILFHQEWTENGYLCSCGSPIGSCPFWTEVSNNMDSSNDRSHASRQVDAAYELLKGVSQLSKCEVIIDSSKSLDRLLMLRSDPRIEVKMVHLVRNGLAVAHSLTKSHDRPGTGNKLSTPPTPLIKGILRWLRRNRAYEKAAEQFGPTEYVRVRYEDLCTDPEQVLGKIAGLVSEDFETNMLSPTVKDLHNIAGSRWRYSDQPIHISLDEKWTREMSWTSKFLFQLLAGRLNRSYGYDR